MKLLAILGFLALSAATLPAQDESTPETPKLPPGPLIQKRAPEYSRWTITVSSAPGKPTSQGTSAVSPSVSPLSTPTLFPTPHNIFSSTMITKTGNLIRVIWTDGNREVWNIWVDGARQICVWPGGKRMGIPAPVTAPFGGKLRIANPILQDFSDSDFHGFEWISSSNFTGFDNIGGKKCLIFKNDTSLAAIDFETRLPVELQANGELTLYRFQQISETMQTPPDEVQKYFKSLAPTAAPPVPTPAPY